jgi:proline dehydrogenase
MVAKILSQFDKSSLMVATHNEASVRETLEKMEQYQVDRNQVFFGQLLGMCDHVSFTLGQHGYNVFKYVPYGKVHDVMPYLIRRAAENADVMGGVQKERRLLAAELRRRLLSFWK